MWIKSSAAAVLLLAVLAAASACSTQPTSRRQVCGDFDDLGQKVLASNGFIDNPVFDEAGDLASVAGRYHGLDLSRDADVLHGIADSDSTNGAALMAATDQIASLCGHPLGVGTTSYGIDSASGDTEGDQAGGGDSQGGGDYYAPPTYQQQTVDPDPPTTDTATGPTDEASAQAALQQEVNNDRSSVEQLVGQWVPQLSSKSYGTVADGVTYDYEAIWNDFQTTRQSHADALLLWSGDYTSFTFDNYWVTVVPEPSGTGAQANAWCDSQGFGKDQCFAKRISHSAKPKGSTLPR